MKSKNLQMKLAAMAVLMALLLGAVGMTNGYADNISASKNSYTITWPSSSQGSAMVISQYVSYNVVNENRYWVVNEGDLVTIVATPSYNYGYSVLENWYVTDANNQPVSIIQDGDNPNIGTFTMPASNVTVTASFFRSFLFFAIFEDYQACEELVPAREKDPGGLYEDYVENLQLPHYEELWERSWYYDGNKYRNKGYIFLAQNEKEGFQLFYRDMEKERNLRIEVSPFVDTITNDNILQHSVYREEYFYAEPYETFVTPDSLAEALVPYNGETYKTTVGHNKVFFIELESTKNQTPGYYKSTITAYDGNEVLATRTIYAKVWNFALPENHYSDVVMGLYNHNSGYGSTSSLFKLNGINVDDNGNVAECDLPAAKQILDGYHECLLEHGVSTYEIPRWKMADDPKAAELIMANPCRKVFSVPVNHNDFNGGEFSSSAQEVIANYKNLVYNNPFLKDKTFFYLMDEPDVNEGTEALLNAISNNLTTLWPGYHAVVPFNNLKGSYSDNISLLEGKTDILCPNLGLLDPYKAPTEEFPNNPFDPVEYALKQSNFEDFIDRDNHPNRFRTWRYPGDGQCGSTQFWIHALATAGVMRRIVFWQQYRMNSDGWLYWNCAYLPDNWVKKKLPASTGIQTGNGDGVLLYPGTMFGQSAEMPVVSLRLKQLSAGIDDYDYLQLAKEFLTEEVISSIYSLHYLNTTLDCRFLNRQYGYYKGYTCMRLQRARYYLGKYLSAKDIDHTWDEWQTAVLPDDTHNGLEIRTCSKCGTQESRPKTYSSLYRFVGTENNQWANLSNWANSPETLPAPGEAVVIASNCEINTNTTVFNVVVNDGVNLTIKDGATLTSRMVSTGGNAQVIIEDGAQLYTMSEGVQATVKKNIAAHGGSGGWHFISSSVATDVAPSTDNGIVSSTPINYDLYYYDEPAHYWRNYKEGDNSQDPGFDIEPLKGYLYANASPVTLSFAGTLQPGITATSAPLSYEAQTLTGWNLVGNPFPCNVYIDKSYYVLDEDGSAFYPTPVSIGTAIAPCTGIMVKAEGPDETVTFSKTVPETQGQNNGMLQIAVAQANQRGTSTGSAAIDKAIVSFNEKDALAKFVFNKDNTKLYIPQNGKDYAIAYAEKQGEMPLNFKAMKDGTYTLSINPENVEMGYLHLIDNMTGADVDLLIPKPAEGPETYTFNAKMTDYESRFKLVFSASSVFGDEDGDNATFAFISNGNLIVSNEGEATLQVIDMMGRILNSQSINGNSSVHVNVPVGVYVLRLVNGNDVKVQKIVVK